jgi:hypothetical protein
MSVPDPSLSSVQLIHNDTASLHVNMFGGAIIDFRLRDSKINPLSFKFSTEQMPMNNKQGAPYQGHFLCLGRWGEPSAGEKKAGIPDHGHFANMMWACRSSGQGILKMRADSKLEGLRVDRTIQMDDHFPLYSVDEMVTNINPLGRLYNMVQHPTLAAPFLNKNTKIQCNASKGFHYKNYRDFEKYASTWPYGMDENEAISDLRLCDSGVSSVFSFVVDDNSRHGWITAHSPDSRLLIGYIWDKQDYPWINLWKEWDQVGIKYCGLEFGTTGVHQPFPEILGQGKLTIFNHNTVRYIDADEINSRRYISFMIETTDDFGDIECINIREGSLWIKQRKNDLSIEMRSGLLDGW